MRTKCIYLRHILNKGHHDGKMRIFERTNHQPMKRILLIAASLLGLCAAAAAQQRVERWGCFELSLPAAVQGNPFDVELTATFTNGAASQTVRGFYDGDGTFKVRFMPGTEGTWTYVTASRAGALNRRRGSFVCTAPAEGNHGPVEPDGLHFKYADGTRYYPVGTTAYDWMHVGDAAAERTIASLQASGFNKVRMLFFLHNLPVEYPDVYPFEKKADGSWDYERFNPAYFQYVERRILALQRIGVEADLVLFHPYDGGRWGFDRMPLEANLRYLSYITARFSAFRNLWWSLANEWDGVKGIPAGDWDKFAQAVSAGMIIGILAHEMGHVCLGHVMGPNYYKTNQEIGRNHEREADSFASSITAATPFGEYVYEGMLFWHYVLAQQQGNEAVESSHPLERERLENLIRANSSKASALGIRLPN